MRVRHPESLEDVGGQCPDAVHLAGEAYDCADGSAFDVPERVADALAARYGVEVADIADGEETDSTPTDGDEIDTCETIKSDGEVCGRELPCPYHD